MPRVQPLLHSRAHDYGYLIRRWRSAARSHGLRLTPFTAASGFEIFAAETRKPDPAKPWIYLSAGIHGDEPASTEACLEWLATTAVAPGECNLLLFPCLNPWGLVNNMRLDADGRDLNRTYHDDSVSQTLAHKQVLAGRRFDLAIAIHEDYDANGIYIYEVKGRQPFLAEQMLAAGARHLPVDTRRSIEGRGSRAGIVRRSIDFFTMPLHPEAFVLHFHHAERTFTIETPSEAHIDSRVAAHVAVVERAVHLCLGRLPDRRRTNYPPSNPLQQK
jgi:hypothetical protein